MGFDYYMYDVFFIGVKCETLGSCYSEFCDENNIKLFCIEINNLIEYICFCKIGRFYLFYFMLLLKFSGLCGFLMVSYVKVLFYI